MPGPLNPALIALAVALSAAVSDSVAVEPRAILEQTRKLRPEVLELALRAYDRVTATGVVRRRVLIIVDYELPSFEKRLWAIDMDAERVLYEEWVAHGMGHPRGSGGTMTRTLDLSNDGGSRKSSLGLFVTGETYYGKHGYSLRLDGLERGYNDNARERLIVLHGAHYVSSDRASKRLVGRSWGCPVVRPEITAALIESIKEGSVLWVYYPDPEWLQRSEFLEAE